MSGLIHRALVSIITLGLIIVSTVHVQADEADIARMLKSIEQRLSDDVAKQQAIEDGEDRALFCKYCHGSDGNSLKPDVPNLAGQNANYLLEQIEKFATRERDDFIMSPLAANFSPEDKVNIAIFYYSKAVKKQSINEVQAAKGEALFASVCSNCHGIKGYGNQKLARLAGQQLVFVSNALKVFRKNANDPVARAESSRKSTVMEGVAKNLSDEQIDSVAAYVASLP